MKQDLQDYPRALLEYMAERAAAEENTDLLARINEAIPKAAAYAIDHRRGPRRG